MKRLLLVFLVVLTVAADGGGESLDERFLTGLRERRLYRLAEQFGSDKWQRDDLPARERADLAIQLALTYTEHALASPPEKRDELWSLADNVCAAFRERWPENPRRQLVEVQAALVTLAHGEQLAEEAAASANAGHPADVTAALEYLRSASRRLQELTDAVNQQLLERRMRPPARSAVDALTTDELDAMSRHLSLHVARSLSRLGMCYPARTADRDDALLQAVERLEGVAQQTDADVLVWDARVELARSLRELGRLQPAAEHITAWSRDAAPPDAAARLAAEQVRVLLTAGQIEAAKRLADQAVAATRDASVSGDLALARLEASIAAWQRESPARQKAQATSLTRQLGAIRERFGAYWGRRAELLVGRALAASTPDGSPDSLLLAAEHLYHTGRTDEAVAAYDRAAETFAKNQRSEDAFGVGMTAAAIERRAGRHAEAARRYRELALKHSLHARAAEAHQLAILSTADELRGAAPDERQLLADKYAALLAEHLTRWPESPAAGDVRWWLGRLRAGRNDWAAAIDSLTQIPPTSTHYPNAVNLSIDCYEATLSSTALNQPIDRANALAAATRYLQPIITGPDNHWPAEWTTLQREAAVALAGMHVQYEGGDATYAERLLEAALSSSVAAAPDATTSSNWDRKARRLLVLARVRGGHSVDADQYQAAIATYAALAAQSPDDGEIQESFATLLSQGNSADALRQALAQWQEVEQHSRRGGSRWRRARRARIELLTRLGDHDEAEKLTRLTRLLYPDWEEGGSR